MATNVTDQLLAAKDAARRHDWDSAFAALSDADKKEGLPPDELMLLADVAWWSGHLEEELACLERAYSRYLAEGNRRRAGAVALWLADEYASAGSVSMVSGWRARGARLIEAEPEGVEHGYLAYTRGRLARAGGDADAAIGLFRVAVELAERYGDRDLWALSTQGLGWSLLDAGDVDEGLPLIDETATCAVAGELSAVTTGIVFCRAISICRELVDLKRATEWTDAARRWCSQEAITGFPGVCRVHRAELLRLRGAWSEAGVEARLASEELPRYSPAMAGEAFAELAELRLRMGDLDGTEGALDQACALGQSGEPARSLLTLLRGNAAAAVSSIRRALREDTASRLQRGRLLLPLVDIALNAGAMDDAVAGAEELETFAADYGSELFRASAAQARGSVQLAGGDPERAITSLGRALKYWLQIDAPYEAARVRTLTAQAYRSLGEQDAAARELRAAQAVFERLGARRDARLVSATLADLARQASPAALRTFLFSDIVSSTQLVEAIGDSAWRDLMQWHDRTLRGIFSEFGGEEVDHAGDGFFVAFSEPVAALSCAVAIQRQLAEHRSAHGFAPRVRIGVHRADAVQTGPAYKGKGVHEAARIAALAGGDEVLASAETVAAAGNRFPTCDPRTFELKGMSQPVDIVALDWPRSSLSAW